MNIVPVDEASTPPPALASGLPDADGRIACDTCARSFKPKADGTIRAHKCGENVTTVAGKTRARRTVVKAAPVAVRRLGVATLAGGTEWVARGIVARGVPCSPAEVPPAVTDLPDADAMIGPLIDELWPSLPPGIQKTLIKMSDKEDLIAAAFAWWEYGQQLKQWADIEGDRRSELKRGQTVEVLAAPTVGTPFGSFYDSAIADATAPM